MKITLIIVFISTIFVCSETLNLKIPIIGLNINLQFGDFQKKFNKTYSTVEELNRRLLIFTDNVLKFAEHNVLYTLGQVTHKVGINQFSDWTQDEFMNYINRGLLKKTRKVRSVRRKPVEQLPVENVNLPSHVDWRDKGVVTNIKDQGLCGSCWAFSATGALETHLKITNGTLVALSEQHLIDCSWDENNEGCSGGLVSYAFDFVKNHGIKSESDYPYIDDDGKCNKQDTTQLVTAISGYVDIPIGSEMDLQITLANVGPVSVAIDGTYELQTYESGILDDKFCTTNDLNHAVLLVGYGTENGIEYYIMKNSWGSYWGEKGYFRMVRNKGNRCGIATMASYPVM